MGRPAGVTILAVLSFLAAAVMVFSAIGTSLYMNTSRGPGGERAVDMGG